MRCGGMEQLQEKWGRRNRASKHRRRRGETRRARLINVGDPMMSVKGAGRVARKSPNVVVRVRENDLWKGQTSDMEPARSGKGGHKDKPTIGGHTYLARHLCTPYLQIPQTGFNK